MKLPNATRSLTEGMALGYRNADTTLNKKSLEHKF